LFVIANTSANVNYQWFRNGEPLAGATSPSYVISSMKAENAGTYTVRVSNSSGGEPSAPAVIQVIQLPKIVQAPAASNVNEGAVLFLSVEASGTGPLAYQWLKNGTSIAGATSASFVVNSATASDAGNYSVRVSNAAGNVTSSAAAVTIVSK